jgi:hypothetical protein
MWWADSFKHMGSVIMIVYVAFKFDGVDPDSERADEIVAEITGACEVMQKGVNADECWVDDAVNEAKGEV